jgi:hypothetical protein
LYAPDQLKFARHYFLRGSARNVPWGFKDPRISLTLRFWQAALPRLQMIYIHRDPIKSITSLWRRAYMDMRSEKPKAPWLNESIVFNLKFLADLYCHNAYSFLSAARAMRGEDSVLVIPYNLIVSGEVDLVNVVNRSFGMELADVSIKEVYDQGAVTSESRLVHFDHMVEERLRHIDYEIMKLAEESLDGHG